MSKFWSPANQLSFNNDLVAWYDAKDPNDNSGLGLPDDGVDVHSWKDKSIYQNEFTPSGTSLAPSYDATNSAIVFDGTEDLLGSFPVGFELHMFIVAEMTLQAASETNHLIYFDSPTHANLDASFVDEGDFSGNGTLDCIHTKFTGPSTLPTRGTILVLNNGASNCVLSFASFTAHGLSTNDSIYLIVGARASRDVGDLPTNLTTGSYQVTVTDANNFTVARANTDMLVTPSGNSVSAFLDEVVEIQILTTTASTLPPSGTPDHLNLSTGSATKAVFELIVKSDGTIKTTLGGDTYTTSAASVNGGIDPLSVVRLAGKADHRTECKFHEILVYKSDQGLTNSEFIQGYLRNKWGLTTTISPSHPMYQVKPTLKLAEQLQNRALFGSSGSATQSLGSYYNSAQRISPRRPVQIVRLWMDKCDNIYNNSTAPSTCAAVGDLSGACYNTKSSCLNNENYRLSSNGRKAYTYISEEVGLYVDNKFGTMYPAVKNVSGASAEMKRTGGVSVRGTVNIKLQDFKSNDSELDPYFLSRNYIASDRGSHFQRFLQRNKFYQNRPVEVFNGYILPNGNLEIFDGRQEYIIDTISHDYNSITVKCKDPLTLADELKAKVPAPTNFRLSAAIADTSSTFTNRALKFAGSTASQANIIEEFGADTTAGFVRIGDEILGYEVEADGSDALINFTSRGQWGTTAETHDADAKVQKCLFYGTYGGNDGSKINDVVYDLLVNQAGVPARAINNVAGAEFSWADEKTTWLADFDINTIISKPTSVNKLVGNFGEHCGVDFVWNAFAAKILMRAQTPRLLNIQTLSEDFEFIGDDQIIQNSFKGKIDDKDRVSRAGYYYAVKNFAEDLDDPDNFNRIFVALDADSEAVEEYGSKSEKLIYAYSINQNDSAKTIAGRMLKRHQETPLTATFEVDVIKEPVDVGENFYLSTKNFVSVKGLPAILEMQCISIKHNFEKQTFSLKAKQFGYRGDATGAIMASGTAAFTATSNFVNLGSGTENSPYTGALSIGTWLANEYYVSVAAITDGGDSYNVNDQIAFADANYEDAEGNTVTSSGLNMTVSAIESVDKGSGSITAFHAIDSASSGGSASFGNGNFYDGQTLTASTGSGAKCVIVINVSPKMEEGKEPYNMV
tara:strand:+ start:1035 stop:4430 length:3396 start_codon:yes stop_codon:yes gene_type:complete